MKLVILGPPGAGKGTYASRLTKKLDIPHISTGDIVREEIKSQSKIGKTIKQYSEKGALVPDTIINQLLAKRLNKSDCTKGFILDGYPRTINQAESLEKIAKIDVVINLNVSDKIIIDRLSSRILCSECGAIYNKKTLKPKIENVCDICSGRLYQRNDDKPKIIQERLDIYKNKTEPLIQYYLQKDLLKNIYCDNPSCPPKSIVNKILLALEKHQ